MAKMNHEMEFTNEMIVEVIKKTVSDMNLEEVESIRIAKVDGEIIFAITPSEKDDEDYEVVKTGDKVNFNITLGE